MLGLTREAIDLLADFTLEYINVVLVLAETGAVWRLAVVYVLHRSFGLFHRLGQVLLVFLGGHQSFNFSVLQRRITGVLVVSVRALDHGRVRILYGVG